VKFKDYVEKLNAILAEHPNYADLEVFASVDDEGNRYGRIEGGYSVGMTHEPLTSYDIDSYDCEEWFKETDEYLDYLAEHEYWAEEGAAAGDEEPVEPKFAANVIVFYPH
jgi:hypothetical protein